MSIAITIASSMSAPMESGIPRSSAALGRVAVNTIFTNPKARMTAESGTAMRLSGTPSGAIMPKWYIAMGVATSHATTDTANIERHHWPSISPAVETVGFGSPNHLRRTNGER